MKKGGKLSANASGDSRSASMAQNTGSRVKGGGSRNSEKCGGKFKGGTKPRTKAM